MAIQRAAVTIQRAAVSSQRAAAATQRAPATIQRPDVVTIHRNWPHGPPTRPTRGRTSAPRKSASSPRVRWPRRGGGRGRSSAVRWFGASSNRPATTDVVPSVARRPAAHRGGAIGLGNPWGPRAAQWSPQFCSLTLRLLPRL